MTSVLLTTLRALDELVVVLLALFLIGVTVLVRDAARDLRRGLPDDTGPTSSAAPDALPEYDTVPGPRRGPARTRREP